ncbi:MAG: tyrosine-type recombinase/integrase [Candidatus Dormibacteraceae bacterium]
MAVEVQSRVRSSGVGRTVSAAADRTIRDSRLGSIGADFRRALLRRNLSPATVRSYLGGCDHLFRFVREQGIDDLHDLTRDLLERWQDSMLVRGPLLKANSRGLYCKAVKQLIDWAADQGMVDARLERAIVKVKKSRGQPRPLTPEALATIRAFLQPRRPGMTAVELRDRAMFHYFLTSGARVSEALQVRRKNFERAVVRQKGGSDKQLVIPPTVEAMVHDYLSARRDDLPWLWITHSNQPSRRLADSGVREAWRRLCHRLKLRRFTTHQLRHSCATEMLDAGVGESATADHLGHHDLSTLSVYGQVRGHQREEALDVMEQLAESTTAGRQHSAARRTQAGDSDSQRSRAARLRTPRQVFDAVRSGLISPPEAKRLLGLEEHSASNASVPKVTELTQASPVPASPPDWFRYVLSLWSPSLRPRRPQRSALEWMERRVAVSGLVEPCELSRVVAIWDTGFDKAAHRLHVKTHHGLVWMVPSFVGWAQAGGPEDESVCAWDWAVGQWTARIVRERGAVIAGGLAQ